jgi:hypothetical protein
MRIVPIAAMVLFLLSHCSLHHPPPDHPLPPPSPPPSPSPPPPLPRILATEPTAGLIEVVSDSVPLKVITKKYFPLPSSVRQKFQSHNTIRYPDSKTPLFDFFVKAYGPVGRCCSRLLLLLLLLLLLRRACVWGQIPVLSFVSLPCLPQRIVQSGAAELHEQHGRLQHDMLPAAGLFSSLSLPLRALFFPVPNRFRIA